MDNSQELETKLQEAGLAGNETVARLKSYFEKMASNPETKNQTFMEMVGYLSKVKQKNGGA